MLKHLCSPCSVAPRSCMFYLVAVILQHVVRDTCAGEKRIFMAPSPQAAEGTVAPALWRGGCSLHRAPGRGLSVTGQRRTVASSRGEVREGEAGLEAERTFGSGTHIFGKFTHFPEARAISETRCLRCPLDNGRRPSSNPLKQKKTFMDSCHGNTEVCWLRAQLDSGPECPSPCLCSCEGWGQGPHSQVGSLWAQAAGSHTSTSSA